MFSQACKKVRQSLYGIIGTSIVAQVGSQSRTNVTNGTGFMVAPGYILTAAHLVHVEGNPKNAVHQQFEVIRAPDVGGRTEKAVLAAEDVIRDVALIKIDNISRDVAALEAGILSRGESCGFLGFPLSQVTSNPGGGKNFQLDERFQGANISNYNIIQHPSGRKLPIYEVDTLMYGGSSGCPGFTTKGKIIGMQVASVMEKNKDGQIGARVAISLVIPSPELIEFTQANIK